MHIEKEKLPRGMSYPLKSSFFEKALMSAGIMVDVHLIHSPGKIFFDVFFWPPNHNVNYERLYVRSGAVPAADGRRTRQFVETIVIPEFVAWVKGILALPPESPIRRQQQHFWRDFPKA